MGERVHTRGGRDVLGQSYREQRVHNGVVRDEHGVVDGIFLVSVRVGNDRGEGRFAARAGRGGNGDERRKLFQDAQQTFHFGNGFAGTRHTSADALRAVHGRTAAERDDDVAVVVLVKFQPFLDVGDGGIGDDLVIDRNVQSLCLEPVDDGLSHTQAHKPLVGDEQRALEALRFRESGEFRKAALARNLFRNAPGQEIFRHIHHSLETSAIQFVKCIHCLPSVKKRFRLICNNFNTYSLNMQQFSPFCGQHNA